MRLVVKTVKFVAQAIAIVALLASAAHADFTVYGDQDLCNTGTYSSDPKAGATLQGLAPGVVTLSSRSFSHNFPFSPAPGDYPGTDQIYVGSVQTSTHDGYSQAASRINGPQVITLNYSNLITPGQAIGTFTLGIGADDFQQPTWRQPFTASINGVTDVVLTNTLNSLNQTGPYEQFFSIGIDPSKLLGNNILTLSVNEGGDGGDGWAIDFLTVGITPQAAPEPSGQISLGLGFFWTLGCVWRRKRGD